LVFDFAFFAMIASRSLRLRSLNSITPPVTLPPRRSRPPRWPPPSR
jgi:hypothetical protein